MTLIEVTIAIGVVMLIVFTALPSVEGFVGIRAREEAGRVAGAIRYLYGASALSGKACRLVFDLDARAWWAECTEARFTVDREKEKSRDGQRVETKEKSQERSGSSGGFAFDARAQGEALKAQIEQKAEFSEFTSEEVPKRALPDGAELAVWTGHQREKYTKGRAFLYFFPQGNTERAHVYVSSGHGDVYTLVVSPLSGKVRIVDEELEVPKD